jgi:carbamoyl-phosphate synthase large subunit
MPKDTSISLNYRFRSYRCWSSMWIWLCGITISSFHPWRRVILSIRIQTIMTDPSWLIIFIWNLTTKSIIEILKAHPQIDAVLPTMGGQTALNVFRSRKEFGKISGKNDRCWCKRYQHNGEQKQFKQLKLGTICLQKYVPYLRGKEIAQEFGFPLVIRPSFTLGTGAAIV